jgi:GT2 family glycosyltransferase
MSEVWCGIPVYNNAGTIADVVSRCRRQIADVVVIDDGSTDADLRELLKPLPLDVPVIRHPTNLGKGKALLTAFSYAEARGARYFITLDGDGQHFPEDIPEFISKLDPDTILIGSRQKVIGKMPYSSRFGREFSDFWVCIESGAVVSDTQSGFRAYPLAAIQGLRLRSRHYNLEVEVVTRAVWAGMKIGSVPIRVQYMEGPNRVSSFRPFADNARISLMHTRLVLRQLVPMPHRRLAADPHPSPLPEYRARGEDLITRVKSLCAENSTPLGLAAAVAVSALLGILLWPWGVIAVGYVAVRLHLNKIVALVTLALCIPKSLPEFCVRVGKAVASPGWARFVGAHIVAFVAAPVAAVLVYSIARRFQPIAPATGSDGI